jgi:hypothetical protein
MFMEQK